jgi:hypothetical protein
VGLVEEIKDNPETNSGQHTQKDAQQRRAQVLLADRAFGGAEKKLHNGFEHALHIVKILVIQSNVHSVKVNL